MTWRNLNDNVSKHPEVRQKISDFAKGTNRQSQLMTPEARKKAIVGISRAKRGVKLSEEHKRKIGEGSKRAGCIPPRNPHLFGINHPNWKGGVSTLRNKDFKNPQYIAFRQKVLNRDKQTCQDCGRRYVQLHVHHIKSWAEYPDLRYSVDNGVTLCRHCHYARHRESPRPKAVSVRTLSQLYSNQNEVS